MQGRPARRSTAGYTLIEILVATTLALMLMGAVVAMFARVGESINDARSMLEAADRLRLAAARLQADLGGLTVTVNPPRDPANNEGYFEYIEGPVVTTPFSANTFGNNTTVNPSLPLPSQIAFNTDNGNSADTSVGDFDDILMFTTRSSGRPFVGLALGSAVQSEVAEVAWFLRGRNLHRRVLLVMPSLNQNTSFTSASASGFYANNDISARMNTTGGTIVANTLGDLTRRECRFAHGNQSTGTFPYDVRNWNWTWGGQTFPTLPTLNECSNASWSLNQSPPAAPGSQLTLPSGTLDFWTNKPGYVLPETALLPAIAKLSPRTTDDIILTNVIGFDVKAWDPTYVDPATGAVGAYVDLGYNGRLADTKGTYGLQGFGNNYKLPQWSSVAGRVYDTFSTHYEVAGWYNNGTQACSTPGQSVDGLDDGGITGVVDDIGCQSGENLTYPPYAMPLRGIQVKIRTFEPDSKQVREVTVEQSFLPQ
jgi:type II secretory pathway pseudopilin PulG